MTGDRTYLFCGGGSGGHLFPGIAVADELRARQPSCRCVFIGSEREIERRVIADSGYEHRTLAIAPSTMLRRNPFAFAWRYWRSSREARRLCHELRPAVAIGLGGFASVPMIRAATAGSVPIVLLEQNAVPGRATRWLQRSADVICLSLPGSERFLPNAKNIELTGNPVRRSMQSPRRAADVDSGDVLVLGGSQGAVAVNEAMLGAVAELKDDLAGRRIVHQTGDRDADRVRARYRELNVDAIVQRFFDDLDERYVTAAVAVARAGATSLAELACAGVPTVLIPYPGAIHDHQQRNAEVYRDAGAAWIVEQATDRVDTNRVLAARLRDLLSDPDSLAAASTSMRALAKPEAATRVADEILARVR